MSVGSQLKQRAKLPLLRCLSYMGLCGSQDASPHLLSPPTERLVSSDTPTDAPRKHSTVLGIPCSGKPTPHPVRKGLASYFSITENFVLY